MNMTRQLPLGPQGWRLHTERSAIKLRRCILPFDNRLELKTSRTKPISGTRLRAGLSPWRLRTLEAKILGGHHNSPEPGNGIRRMAAWCGPFRHSTG